MKHFKTIQFTVVYVAVETLKENSQEIVDTLQTVQHSRSISLWSQQFNLPVIVAVETFQTVQGIVVTNSSGKSRVINLTAWNCHRVILTCSTCCRYITNRDQHSRSISLWSQQFKLLVIVAVEALQMVQDIVVTNNSGKPRVINLTSWNSLILSWNRLL